MEIHTPSFDFGNIKDRVDQPQQVFGADQHFVQVLHLFLRQHRWTIGRGGFAPYNAGKADDGVERGAQLMAHIGEKGAFGLVGRFGGLFGLVQLCLGLFDLGNIQHTGKERLLPIKNHGLKRKRDPNRRAIDPFEPNFALAYKASALQISHNGGAFARVKIEIGRALPQQVVGTPATQCRDLVIGVED